MTTTWVAASGTDVQWLNEHVILGRTRAQSVVRSLILQMGRNVDIGYVM